MGAVRANSAYAFFAVGVFWLAVAVLGGSPLVLWPVVACVFGGVLLKVWPGRRLTWAWAVSTVGMGLLLAAYQVYAWLPYLGGTFSSVASEAAAVFAVLAVLQVVLVYAGLGPMKRASA